MDDRFEVVEAEMRSLASALLAQLEADAVNGDTFTRFLEVMGHATELKALPTAPRSFVEVSHDLWARVAEAAMQNETLRPAIEKVLADEMRATGATN